MPSVFPESFSPDTFEPRSAMVEAAVPSHLGANLHDLLAYAPEHPVPHAGDVVSLTYGQERGPLVVAVEADASGVASLTVTAPASEVAHSMDLARRALIRSIGADPEDPASLGQAREKIGAMAFADNVGMLTRQRLFGIACMQTRILPFLAPQYLRDEGPRPDRDFTFQVRARLRPHVALTSYEPVELAFPPCDDISDQQIDERLGTMMGGEVRWADVPDEARGALDKLRGRVREQLELEGTGEQRGKVAEACTQVLMERLATPVDERYVELLRDQIANQFAANVEAGGTSWESYMADPSFNMDEFKAAMTQNARQSLRQGLALDAMADYAGIELDEEDVKAAVGPIAGGYGEGAAQAMLDSGQLPQLCEVARRAKTADWVAQQARDLTAPQDVAGADAAPAQA